MSATESSRVIGKDGLQGTIIRTEPAADGSATQALVQFADGQQAIMPLHTLVAQADGSYYAPISQADLNARQTTTMAAGETVVLPVVAEELEVGKQTITTGVVRVRKLVHEREEMVDEPLLREEVQVERIPINQVIDQPVPVRHEGDTLVVPILEEVLVIEKRLMLKEELRIRKHKTEFHASQSVTLRSEEVIVERADPLDQRPGEGIDRT
jgi:uncharacterized protein (TIGR02271 family)